MVVLIAGGLGIYAFTLIPKTIGEKPAFSLGTMGFTPDGAATNAAGAFLTCAVIDWVRADVLRFWALVIPSFLCSQGPVSSAARQQ